MVSDMFATGSIIKSALFHVCFTDLSRPKVCICANVLCLCSYVLSGALCIVEC